MMCFYLHCQGQTKTPVSLCHLTQLSDSIVASCQTISGGELTEATVCDAVLLAYKRPVCRETYSTFTLMTSAKVSHPA